MCNSRRSIIERVHLILPGRTAIPFETDNTGNDTLRTHTTSRADCAANKASVKAFSGVRLHHQEDAPVH